MNNISKVFMSVIILGTIIVISMFLISSMNTTDKLGTFDNYYIKWLNTPSTDRPSNPVSAYNGMWEERANVNPILPLSILITFFSFLGYLYYFDWKYEPQLEMFGRYGGYYEL